MGPRCSLWEEFIMTVLESTILIVVVLGIIGGMLLKRSRCRSCDSPNVELKETNEFIWADEDSDGKRVQLAEPYVKHRMFRVCGACGACKLLAEWGSKAEGQEI